MEFPKEALIEYIMDGEDCEEHGLTFVEAGEWIDEGKWSHKSWVFEHDGKFYEVTNGRSGSYFSDYYYEHEDWGDMVDCAEVEKVEVTTYEWRPVRKR